MNQDEQHSGSSGLGGADATGSQLKLDIRYARCDNFLGYPVYTQARAFCNVRWWRLWCGSSRPWLQKGWVANP
ncbi:MAG: hypothetical protein ACUVRV_12545 [Cyanobacteriota bacterium]